MSIVLEHPDGQIHVDETTNGKKRIVVDLFDKSRFVKSKICETSYPIELVNLILNIKGPGYLCDEIMRDEDQSYVQKSLVNDILGYIGKDDFDDKTVLDFGCGSGASTMILARIFPKTQIVGVDIDDNLLSIAKSRAEYYGFKNIKFVLSPSSEELPRDIGYFDFVILSAVYEHLLPTERKLLLSQIWPLIQPNGVLFINQTPHRYFPIEGHTTNLPLINYFPDRIVRSIACRFSNRVKNYDSWETLLRKGIRGATEGEIMNILCEEYYENPILLEPCRLGFHDRIDMWYASSNLKSEYRELLKYMFKFIKNISYITLAPELSLAIKKSDSLLHLKDANKLKN